MQYNLYRKRSYFTERSPNCWLLFLLQHRNSYVNIAYCLIYTMKTEVTFSLSRSILKPTIKQIFYMLTFSEMASMVFLCRCIYVQDGVSISIKITFLNIVTSIFTLPWVSFQREIYVLQFSYMITQ